MPFFQGGKEGPQKKCGFVAEIAAQTENSLATSKSSERFERCVERKIFSLNPRDNLLDEFFYSFEVGGCEVYGSTKEKKKKLAVTGLKKGSREGKQILRSL